MLVHDILNACTNTNLVWNSLHEYHWNRHLKINNNISRLTASEPICMQPSIWYTTATQSEHINCKQGAAKLFQHLWKSPDRDTMTHPFESWHSD